MKDKKIFDALNSELNTLQIKIGFAKKDVSEENKIIAQNLKESLIKLQNDFIKVLEAEFYN